MCEHFPLTAEICSEMFYSACSALAAHPTPGKELNKNGGKGEEQKTNARNFTPQIRKHLERATGMLQQTALAERKFFGSDINSAVSNAFSRAGFQVKVSLVSGMIEWYLKKKRNQQMRLLLLGSHLLII